ncbi:MAG: hypothetical protein ACFHU9_06395 [Fluviicola sp.]
MKYLIALLALILTNSSFSQNFTESKYVHEGRSYHFVVPNSYDELPAGDDEMSAYCRDLMSIEAGEMTDIILVGNIWNDDEKDLDALMSDAEFDILEDVKDPEISSYVTSKGKEFRTVKGEVNFFGEDPSNGFIGITTFGEVIVIVGIFDLEDGETVDPSLLTAMLNSYSEYETDRENQFFPTSENWDDIEDIGFENNLYETNLIYDNTGFFPEYDEDSDWFWDEDWSDEYMELLLAYGYYNLNDDEEDAPGCGMKVFSGGYSDNYKTDLSKLVALQKVFPSHYIEGIAAEGTVAGDEFNFKTYTVSSSAYGYAKQKLYVTEVNGETVFILSYFTQEPTESLENEMENVVKTFDYLD